MIGRKTEVVSVPHTLSMETRDVGFIPLTAIEFAKAHQLATFKCDTIANMVASISTILLLSFPIPLLIPTIIPIATLILLSLGQHLLVLLKLSIVPIMGDILAKCDHPHHN